MRTEDQLLVDYATNKARRGIFKRKLARLCKWCMMTQRNEDHKEESHEESLRLSGAAWDVMCQEVSVQDDEDPGAACLLVRAAVVRTFSVFVATCRISRSARMAERPDRPKHTNC